MIKKIAYIAGAAKRIAFFRSQYPLSVLLKEILVFPSDYFLRSGRSSSVRNLTVIVNNQCNFRCKWCFYKDELDRAATLDLALYNKLIDDVAKDRPAIVLSGGEPFANKNILEYVKKARQYKLHVSIFTNGVLLNPDTLEKLAELGLDYLCVSIIGPEPVHDKVTGTKTFGKLKENLEYLGKMDRKGMKLIINVTLFKEMLDNFEYISDLVTKYKVDAVRFQHLNFLRDEEFKSNDKVFADKFNFNLQLHQNKDVPDLNNEDLARMCRFIEEMPGLRQEAPALSKNEMKEWYLGQKFRTDRRCIFPWRGAQIGADGFVYPCYKMYYPLGNLKEKPFYEIWNDERYVKFRNELKKSLFPGCARCCKL